MAHLSGRSVWPATERIVSSKKAASFLAGVIRMYLIGDRRMGRI
jgi:hypothetical protein